MSSRGAKLFCREHPDATLIEDYRAGDMICSACGLVVGDRVVDVGSEWRTFSNEKANSDPSRVGASENPLLNGSDLSTFIAREGNQLSAEEGGGTKYHNRKTISSSDRALMNAFREIGNMADRISLAKTIVGRCCDFIWWLKKRRKRRAHRSSLNRFCRGLRVEWSTQTLTKGG